MKLVVALCVLGLFIACALIALIYRRLPGRADRLVAVDALSSCALAACLIAAALSGETAFLDVAIGFALVAFLGTVSWASALAKREEDEK
ncbi:multisubunit sodium/proton antiporter MrpF subunit [Crenobacter luteus]|nr:monovalent cation/H+ antiporter complex subunit F [Crenobacter luteus]TCP13029.1 multisubunit sodium/proton antiporter MrpF subunit [Crenobacter luteus]